MNINIDNAKKVITVQLLPTKKQMLKFGLLALVVYKVFRPKTFKYVETKQIVTHVDKATYLVTNIDKFVK